MTDTTSLSRSRRRLAVYGSVVCKKCARESSIRHMLNCALRDGDGTCLAALLKEVLHTPQYERWVDDAMIIAANKTVLLRERKRHTARCVASTCSVILGGGGGTYPGGGVPTLVGGVPTLGVGEGTYLRRGYLP